MRTQATLLSIALLLTAGAYAQDTPAEPPPAQDPGCLLATERDDWMALGLTSAQMDEVQGLHTACTTDCTIVKGSTKELVPVPAVLEEYEAKVRRVLGEEKYQQWLQWCAERPTKG